MCIIQQYLQYFYEHNVETTDKTDNELKVAEHVCV